MDMKNSNSTKNRKDSTLDTSSLVLAPPAPPAPSYGVKLCLPGSVFEPEESAKSSVPPNNSIWDNKDLAATATEFKAPKVKAKKRKVKEEEDKVPSARKLMEKVKVVVVNQKMNPDEGVINCSLETYFTVDEATINGGEENDLVTITKEKIFEATETSKWCSRNCIGSDSKAFFMEVKYLHNDPRFGESYKPFLRIERSCICNCFCLGKPRLNVYYSDNGHEVQIGRVIQKVTCNDIEYEMYLNKDNIRPSYKIRTDYYSEWPCCRKSAAEIIFDIVECNKENIVGYIRKFCKNEDENESIPNSYRIEFPRYVSWEAKALMFSTGLFIKYYYYMERFDVFEKSKEEKEDGEEDEEEENEKEKEEEEEEDKKEEGEDNKENNNSKGDNKEDSKEVENGDFKRVNLTENVLNAKKEDNVLKDEVVTDLKKKKRKRKVVNGSKE